LVTQRITVTGTKDAGRVLLCTTFPGQPAHAGWPATTGGPVVVVGTGAALADADAGELAAPVPDVPPEAAGVLVLAVAQPVAIAATAATAAIRVASCIM
jgi:hypothetical protein